MSARRAAFFDCDGTLMEEVCYCSDPSLVKVFPGAGDALDNLRAAGFAIVVASNQSGIGRGMFSDAQYQAVQAEFLRQIGSHRVDASYYCPDVPGVPSACRKPEPGMLLAAARDLGFDLEQSWMIGDKAIDIECGRRAGARTILVRTGYGAEQQCDADFTAADAVEAAQLILKSMIQPAEMRDGDLALALVSIGPHPYHKVPTYQFRMVHAATGEEFGYINLRLASTRHIEMYGGHVGYGVHEPHRGHRYATRSVRLLLPLARRLGFDRLWITCDPENAASRRTLELAGAQFVEIVAVPEDCLIHKSGHPRKCRYQLDLGAV